VRNLERAGVSRSAAMKMVGNKTQEIYSRYALADETALKEAALKIDKALTRANPNKKEALQLSYISAHSRSYLS